MIVNVSGPIETLIERGREFTARVLLASLNASCAALLTLAAITSFSARWIAFAQAPQPAFEVASIKRHIGESNSSSFGPRPGGRLEAVNNTFANVINNAYGISGYQLVGAPNWVNSESYDIEARGPVTAREKDIMLMLQTLLVDRLAMKAHFETREMAAYILSVAKEGAKLHLSETEDCVPRNLTRPAEPVTNVCGNSLRNRNGWRATHISMSGVTHLLASALQRPVIDQTGIKGTFDVQMQWSDDLTLPDNPNGPPSLTTALRETLGLEVKSGRGPVEVLVIDHIEKPSAN